MSDDYDRRLVLEGIQRSASNPTRVTLDVRYGGHAQKVIVGRPDLDKLRLEADLANEFLEFVEVPWLICTSPFAMNLLCATTESFLEGIAVELPLDLTSQYRLKHLEAFDKEPFPVVSSELEARAAKVEVRNFVFEPGLVESSWSAELDGVHIHGSGRVLMATGCLPVISWRKGTDPNVLTDAQMLELTRHIYWDVFVDELSAPVGLLPTKSIDLRASISLRSIFPSVDTSLPRLPLIPQLEAIVRWVPNWQARKAGEFQPPDGMTVGVESRGWELQPGSHSIDVDEGRPVSTTFYIADLAGSEPDQAIGTLEQCFDYAREVLQQALGPPVGVWRWDDPNAPDNCSDGKVAQWSKRSTLWTMTMHRLPDIDVAYVALTLEPSRS